MWLKTGGTLPEQACPAMVTSAQLKQELEPEAFLGDEHTASRVKEIGRVYLEPRLKAGDVLIGTYRKVHMAYVAPDYHYQRRWQILATYS